MSRHVEKAIEYAESVKDDPKKACLYVRQACQRQLDDLTRAKKKSYPFEFVPKKAAAVCDFIQLMPHVKGSKWKGKSIELEPWQQFGVTTVFGWVRPSGKRRFRRVYWEIPRKNSKSTLSAGVGKYMLTEDGEHGAEIYSGATTEKQAHEVFRPAWLMADSNAELREYYGVELGGTRKNPGPIYVPSTNSKFEAIIGKPGDGASPHMAIVDEYHEHSSDELYDTMLTGMGAREQPLMWVITTAGSDTAGPCYALRSDVIKVLNGTMDNEELFGIIYTLDEGDDWKTEEALRKANPNYDVSVFGDYLKAQVKDAIQSSRKQNVVKRKHFNLWTGAASAWMNMELWADCAIESTDAGEPVLSEADFEGEPCWIGLDLASKIDIAAKVKLFKRDETYYLFSTNYLPEERINDPDKSNYSGWMYDGHLKATEGDVIDYGRIKDDLLEDFRKYDVVAVGYDPWSATQLATELIEEGVNMIEVRQSVKQLSEPMKHLEAMVLAGRLKHDDNPCFNWQMGNVVARVDANDNIYPRKERDESKIDGPVAAILAMTMERTQEETVMPSILTL